MTHQSLLYMKLMMTATGGFWAGWVLPPLPCVTLCTILTLLDVVSAVRLSRRLRKKKLTENGDGKISSRKFGRVLLTLGKIYGALGIAAFADAALAGVTPGFSAVKAVTAAVTLWQLMSVLENEAAASDARWAGVARKWLVNKAARHLGLDSDDFKP